MTWNEQRTWSTGEIPTPPELLDSVNTRILVPGIGEYRLDTMFHWPCKPDQDAVE